MLLACAKTRSYALSSSLSAESVRGESDRSTCIWLPSSKVMRSAMVSGAVRYSVMFRFSVLTR